MVRSYRKYEADRSFGTICTATSNAIWLPTSSVNKSSAGRTYSGANEDVLCWDLKTSELLSTWHDGDNKSEVTFIAPCNAQPDLVAAGYSDGSIRIWDALSGQIVLNFNGHRSAITQLRFDSDGARLISGSKDTDIIVWNLLSETAEFRLRGHKDQITGLGILRTPVNTRQSPSLDEAVDVVQETEERYLLSTSKDALVKIWDLQSPACIETHVAQTNGECWALALNNDTDGCITAGNDGELRVWSVDLNSLGALGGLLDTKKSDVLKSQGILHRQGKDRTTGIHFHPKQDYIAVHGSDKAVEIWRIRTAEEVHKHLQRKRRRRREKASATGIELPIDESSDAPDAEDVFIPYVIIRTTGKVKSIDWAGKGTSKALSLLVATTNNQLEVYSITTHSANTSKEAPEYERTLGVELPGHRTDVRALALSSDDRMLASASNGQLKIWNLKTRSCLRTLECGQALCAAFLPGDRIVLLGTKTGELELHDISTSTLIESIKAHEGAVWTLTVHPDGKNVVTGSADKSARFWRFDVVEEDIPGTRRTMQRLKLTQTRELRLSDEILSIQISPDQRLLAASTLDNTVKVFFCDSLKLFLTLYGHKLPVLSLSISSDSKLIATCSADKNVRIWGLDFGDCHKAFFAHQDSVMGVSFISHPIEGDEKHIAFSCSKDGALKTWDADKFAQIQRLDGHKGEIWAMVVGRTGETIVTAGHDKAIRLWTVGDDLVFLEEERERELEEIYESTLAQNLDRDYREDEAQRGAEDDVAAAGKQTISTLTHGEKIMEALEQAIEDHALMQAYEEEKESNPRLAVPQRNPIFLALGNISAEEHVLKVLQKIPSPSLNDALLVIPFSTLPQLFLFLAIFLNKRMRPELAWRVAYFLLQAHMQQIIASRNMRQVLSDILEGFERWQKEERQIVGFNLAGLDIMSRDARDNERFTYIDDTVEDDADLTKGRKKRAFANVA
ncbi:hypothetical protein AMS68_001955 [Peltaster fructicola]|uniref:Small-subunit processome Utp12 domain-containing protein n=1 Tax=Peltaster fructicola TaxID=286661 RepID=A0A6H0XP83_9PEZI|nr:hypothetical protein AMS68_001955 [Peltaster fructicola]